MEVITIVSGVRRRRVAGDKMRLIAGAFPIQCLEGLFATAMVNSTPDTLDTTAWLSIMPTAGNCMALWICNRSQTALTAAAECLGMHGSGFADRE